MTLTRKQKDRLRDQLRPLVNDEVQEAVERAVGRILKDESNQSPYVDKIFDRGGRGGRKGSLPHSAKVFARLGLATAIGQDSAMALEAARTLNIEDEYKKAMSAGSAADGGLLLQDDQANEVIELLRPVSVMRQIGAREVPIPRGAMRTPRIDVGASSGYVAEGAAIPASDIKTGSVVLTAKKLATLVVLTNELARFSQGDVNVDEIVLNEMLASMGETEDVQFIFGTGSEASPTGITVQVAAASKFDATAGQAIDDVVSDLQTLMAKLANANVKMRQPVWIWSPRTSLFLMTLLNANGQFVFRSEIEQGRLFRWPYFETNNIPNNLGAGTDESLVIAADASEIMLGDVAQVGIDRSTAATVTLDGNLTSLFETDRAAIRTRTWNDIRLRHDVGVAVMEKVQWGA